MLPQRDGREVGIAKQEMTTTSSGKIKIKNQRKGQSPSSLRLTGF